MRVSTSKQLKPASSRN